MYNYLMNNIEKSLKGHMVGESVDYEDVAFLSLLPKYRLTALLRKCGYRPDYNVPGRWVRMSEREYLYGYSYRLTSRDERRRRLGALSRDMPYTDMEVRRTCGMAMPRAEMDEDMASLGWSRDGKKIWRYKDDK